MAAAFRVNVTRASFVGIAIALGVGSGAVAQETAQPGQLQAGGQPQVNSTQSLRLPQNPQLFGTAMPSVVKATAIVNGDVITQTDVQQRLAFLAIANGGQIPPEEVDRLRDQVLRNLIDETLEIQAAKTEKIEIKQSDIDKTIQRVAENAKQDPGAACSICSRRTAPTSSRCSARSRARSPGSGSSAPRSKVESRSATTRSRQFSTSSTRRRARKSIRVGEIFLSATPATASPKRSTMRTRSGPAPAGGLVRGLRPAIFRSIDRGGRRRSRVGPAGTASNGSGDGPPRHAGRLHQQSDPGTRWFLDHRRAGHAQDPHARSRAMRSSV